VRSIDLVNIIAQRAEQTLSRISDDVLPACTKLELHAAYAYDAHYTYHLYWSSLNAFPRNTHIKYIMYIIHTQRVTEIYDWMSESVSFALSFCYTPYIDVRYTNNRLFSQPAKCSQCRPNLRREYHFNVSVWHKCIFIRPYFTNIVIITRKLFRP